MWLVQLSLTWTSGTSTRATKDAYRTRRARSRNCPFQLRHAFLEKEQTWSKLSRRRVNFKCTGTFDREQRQTFLDWKVKSAQISRHLRKDKALDYTVHKKSDESVSLWSLETNNVHLLRCFQKTWNSLTKLTTEWSAMSPWAIQPRSTLRTVGLLRSKPDDRTSFRITIPNEDRRTIWTTDKLIRVVQKQDNSIISALTLSIFGKFRATWRDPEIPESHAAANQSALHEWTEESVTEQPRHTTYHQLSIISSDFRQLRGFLEQPSLLFVSLSLFSLRHVSRSWIFPPTIGFVKAHLTTLRRDGLDK